MTRTGDIVAETRSATVDYGDRIMPLWEVGPDTQVRLPWGRAADLTDTEIAGRLAGRSTAVLALGATSRSAALLDAVLSAAPAGMRIYAYCAPSLASDSDLQKFARRSDRVLLRIGPEPPADWLIVDRSSGLLQLGPPQGDRRWLPPLPDAVARSLFNAFCALFWHVADREGLPGRDGKFALRPPLAAPFPHPGTDVALPAGRLVWNAPLPDAMRDAEIKILPSRTAPGRAAKFFVAPAADDFSFPQTLASATTRVVWSDLGLPRTAVSVERLLVDLVEGPIGLQLEWPRGNAVAMLQSLDAVARAPAFEFFPERRLRDVQRSVQLAGWTKPAAMLQRSRIDLGEVMAPLDRFEAARPDMSRRPPDHALAVEYVWRAVPEKAPSNATVADLVRQWRDLDEWAKRIVDDCRKVLGQQAGEADRQTIAGLRNEIDEHGETRPSRRPAQAAAVVEALRATARDTGRLVEGVIKARHDALVRSEEQRQKREWTDRRTTAAQALARSHDELAKARLERSHAQSELDQIDSELKQMDDKLTAGQRDAHAQELAKANDQLDAARRALEKVDQAYLGGKAPKQQRKQLNKAIEQLKQRIAQLNRNPDRTDLQSAGSEEMRELRNRKREMRTRQENAEKTAAGITEEISRLQADVNRPFLFRPPPQPDMTGLPSFADPPPVPNEAPPDIGELLESQGRRFLAVQAWEEVDPARPEAARLKALLVSAR